MVQARRAETHSDGHYVLRGLDPGRYKISVSTDGSDPDDDYNHRWSGRMALNPETRTIQPVKEVPGQIVIAANSCEIRDLAMWPAGDIRGIVSRIDGKPAKGVPCQAFGRYAVTHFLPDATSAAYMLVLTTTRMLSRNPGTRMK